MSQQDDQIFDDEGELRRAVGEMESRRIAPGDAYRSIHLGFGLILFSIGQAWVVWLQVAILAAGIGLIAATQSIPVTIAWLLALAVVSIYIELHIEDWVKKHNDRVDAEIRQLMATAAGVADEWHLSGADHPGEAS